MGSVFESWWDDLTPRPSNSNKNVSVTRLTSCADKSSLLFFATPHFLFPFMLNIRTSFYWEVACMCVVCGLMSLFFGSAADVSRAGKFLLTRFLYLSVRIWERLATRPANQPMPNFSKLIGWLMLFLKQRKIANPKSTPKKGENREIFLRDLTVSCRCVSLALARQQPTTRPHPLPPTTSSWLPRRPGSRWGHTSQPR